MSKFSYGTYLSTSGIPIPPPKRISLRINHTEPDWEPPIHLCPEISGLGSVWRLVKPVRLPNVAVYDHSGGGPHNAFCNFAPFMCLVTAGFSSVRDLKWLQESNLLTITAFGIGSGLPESPPFGPGARHMEDAKTGREAWPKVPDPPSGTSPKLPHRQSESTGGAHHHGEDSTERRKSV